MSEMDKPARRLPPGLGFFRRLSPTLRQPALRSACPMIMGEESGVTTFRLPDDRSRRPTLSTGGSAVRVGPRWRGPNHPRTFLVQAGQPFRLVRYNGGCECSPGLAI